MAAEVIPMPQSEPTTEVAVLPGNLKHGLTAESIVIPSEAEADWLQHLDETTDAYRPQTSVERALTFRIAQLLWRLRRAARAETNDILETEAHRARLAEAEARRGERRPRRPVPAFPDKDVFDGVIRYEAHLNRMLFQTMHELEAMQSSRSGKQAPLARVQIHGGSSDLP
jgi:hypothetical protein